MNRLKIKTIFAIALVAVNLIVAAEKSVADRPRVGLVLSGGGAKGFAHIGVLKMLDSLNIPVDYIAGTSMGGIAGALYSIGYNGIELEQLAFRNDWKEIFTDQPPRKMLPYFQKKETGKYQIEFYLKGLKPTPPRALIFGQKVLLLFISLTYPYEQIENFDQLPIPFRCVTVDLVTGNEVVLKNGSLAKAMRATMAIPTVFSPVEWGDSLLVDGGLINNLPVDVVLEMGADIIIAVDVESPLKDRSELNTAISILNQTVGLLGREKKRKNLTRVDVLVRPDLGGFTAADFDNDKIREIIRRGDRAARKSIKELVVLKEKYELHRFKDIPEKYYRTGQTKVYDLQITGYRIIPFSYIYKRLKIQPGKIFNPDSLKLGIAELKTSGFFEDISYEIIPLSKNFVRLVVRVKELRQPIIHRIEIVGNQYLPFTFIYNLLGLKAGDRLDSEKLSRRIMEIYGLGYFEHIEYRIEPVKENQAILIISVKELPTRRLRMGLRYDDLHKLVAAVSTQATNFLIPGIRFENELQFAGLTKFIGRVSYPSRALNLPVYPFFHIGYKDILTNIFGPEGTKMARYKDRGTSAGIGLGFLFSKYLNVEVQYQYENMDIAPEIAFPDPNMFPSWRDRIHEIVATLDFDLLDDILLPRNGFQIFASYEASLKKFKSDIYYSRVEVNADFYHTFKRKNTFRFYGFYGEGTKELPIYKFFNKGRPRWFVGIEYDQLLCSKMALLRMDYRYEFKNDIYFKLIGNTAFSLEHNTAMGMFKFVDFWGAGVGVKLLSPVGPIEIIFSRGSKSFVEKRSAQNVVYFVLGYCF